jgi:hypothetical protein
LAIACIRSMMMREYEYCLDTCSLYVSGDTYIRGKKNIWMDGDGYRGKDTRPHTVRAQLSGKGSQLSRPLSSPYLLTGAALTVVRQSLHSSRTAWCADYGLGECPARGGGGDSHRSQIILLCQTKYTKTAKKRAVSHTFWLINHRICHFLLRSTVLNKI